jgi:hypothetical protein
MVLIEREAVLAELNGECADVVKLYDNAPAYRDAVLEGLRVARVIVLSEAAKPQIAKERK